MILCGGAVWSFKGSPKGSFKGSPKGSFKGSPKGSWRSPEAGLKNRETSVQAGEDFTLLAVQMI